MLLVHGSLFPGWQTWPAQRPLAGDHRVVVPHRPGYPPGPVARVELEEQAQAIAGLIEPGMHVVGHSYGGIVGLLAADLVPDRIASLTVIEPPAFGVARGDTAVEALVAQLDPLFADTTAADRAFVLRFGSIVGAKLDLPDPLPPEMLAAAQAWRLEPLPWLADLPLERISRAGFPKLVVSGGHHPAFDAVCDVLADGLAAERAVITGAGHSVQRTGEPFNDRLRAAIDTAEAPRPS